MESSSPSPTLPGPTLQTLLCFAGPRGEDTVQLGATVPDQRQREAPLQTPGTQVRETHPAAKGPANGLGPSHNKTVHNAAERLEKKSSTSILFPGETPTNSVGFFMHGRKCD